MAAKKFCINLTSCGQLGFEFNLSAESEERAVELAKEWVSDLGLSINELKLSFLPEDATGTVSITNIDVEEDLIDVKEFADAAAD